MDQPPGLALASNLPYSILRLQEATLLHTRTRTRLGGLAGQQGSTICLKPPEGCQGPRSHGLKGWGQYSLPNREGKPVVQDSHQLLRGLHLFSSTLHPLVLWSPDHRIKSQKSVSELPNVCMWRWGRGGGGRRSQFSTRKVNPAPPGKSRRLQQPSVEQF